MNRLLIIANIIIFAVYWYYYGVYLDVDLDTALGRNFVMIPDEILHGQQMYTLFSSMFMHAGWLHLLGNMLFLWVFGDNIEDTFGHVGYLVFYLVSGLVASFVHIMSIVYAQPLNDLIGVPVSSDLMMGVVGASGAISGVLGAYLVLYPKAKIITIVFYLILPLPAIIFLGVWFILQWFYVFFDLSGGVAYWAHLGGFMVGMALALLFGLKRKKAREARLRF